MIYKIGDIETEFENFKKPTQESFENWKKEFLKLPSVNNYNVWLCGGFINDWDTFDIDIILTNKPNYSELRELLIQGFKIGIKHNVLVDIAYSNIEPSHFNKGEVEKIHYGKKVVKGKWTLWSSKDEDNVYEDLYKTKKSYPRKKQKERNYKVKPMRIN